MSLYRLVESPPRLIYIASGPYVSVSQIILKERRISSWSVQILGNNEENDILRNNEEDDNMPSEQWTNELEQLFAAIESSNKSLMKLSIIIRTSPVRDDYSKAAARYDHDTGLRGFYTNHVRERYGATIGDREWLIERMGLAITRRKHYLMYRRDHHEKLSRDWSGDNNDSKSRKTTTVALTQATGYEDIDFEKDKMREKEDSLGTRTSYANTLSGQSVQHRDVPAPPALAFEGIPFEYGEPFQCPYCYTPQVVEKRTSVEVS